MTFKFLLSLAALSAIVLIHEFGHYIFARIFKVGVETFSVGMGKPLYSFIDKRGTKWQFCAIPLGGYIQPKEQEEAAHGKVFGASFKNASPFKGILIALAGPFFNFFSAFIMLIAISVSFGFPRFSPIVQEVRKDSLAYNKILPGDRILEINNIKINDKIPANIENPNVKIERGSQIINIQLNKPKGAAYKILFSQRFEKLGFVSSSINAFFFIAERVYFTFTSMWSAITSFSIMGPVGILNSSVQMQNQGLVTFLLFIISLSIGIGAFNLLPVPMLDGGRIIMFIIAALTGKKASPKVEKAFNYISLILLGSLFIIGLIGDFKGLIS